MTNNPGEIVPGAGGGGAGSSSLAAAGRAELDQRAAEEASIREERCAENLKRTRRDFYHDFYRDRFRYDPDRRRYVVPDENPLPLWDGGRVLDDGYYFADVGHAPVEFECDGLRWVCRWKYEGLGGDPAYWDDGWWPQWYVVVRRRRRWLPLLRHDVEVQVHGPAGVAEAIS